MEMDRSGYSCLRSFLIDAASRRPDHPALIGPDGASSFGDLHAAARRLAARLLAAGAGRGDRVFVVMANSVEFAAAFWGVQTAGATVVPIHPETKADKLRWLIGDATPRLILADAALEDVVRAAAGAGPEAPALVWNHAGRNAAPPDGHSLQDWLGGPAQPGDALPPLGPDDLAAIIYTSGSTGNPKGVMLSQRNMTTAARSVASYLGYGEADRVYCAIPFTFDYGLHQITMTALAGCSLIVETHFAQPVVNLHRLVTTRATVFPIVPTMAALIAPFAGRFDFPDMRTVTNTAAALTEGLIDQVRAMFPRARLFSMYGLTECHRCTYLDPAELDRRKTSVGKAIPMTELWVVDRDGTARRSDAEGELVIRGATVMQGYWNNPEATARRLRPGPEPGEMVLHTGDICRLDAEGFLYFVSRSDDILKVKGEKVAPAEIEAVLGRHPDVALAAVIGEPDPLLGRRIVAFVEPRAGHAPTTKSLRAWCAAHLESHMRPARYQILDRMPRSQNGKIDRRRLAAPADATREMELHQ